MAASPERHDTSSEQAAAEWVVRNDRGLTPREQQEFQAWRRDQARAERDFQRAEGVWKSLDEGGCDPGLVAAADALEARLRLRSQPRRLFLSTAVILATAAAVTVMFLIGWHWVGTDPESTYRVVASTAKVMELPDGSVATLNGDARITVEFSPLERRVFLVQGEAHFEVVKNPQRPFLVRAGDVTVRAVGTAFNVRLADNSVEVIVTEGRVRIEGTQALTAAPATASPSYGPPPDCPQLTAGERVSVVMRAGEWPQPVQVVTLVPQEIEQALAWQTTRLVFNETALAAVVEAFNAHNERKLELADEQLRVRTLTGVFRADNLDGFVRLVEASIDVRAERTPSGSFRLHALP